MKRTIPLFFVLLLLAAGCQQSTQNQQSEPDTEAAGDPADFHKQLQEQLLLAQPGDVIEIEAGKHHLSNTLSLDGIENITIRGKGMDETTLSFKGQEEGAEGLQIVADGITVEHLTIEDTKGDGIKISDSKDVTLRKVKMIWTDEPKATNGAYGLYPVGCTNVLVEECEVSGAMDAGIYVGQSKQVIVRNNKVYGNVAGLEVENCVQADVYGNHCYNNTGGLFVFDMPELPVKNGRQVRIYDNKVVDNNHPNFAAEGIMVAIVPAGTGMLIMSHDDVEAFNNEIGNHQTVNMAICSYVMTGKSYEDSLFNPYTSAVYVHDNQFTGSEHQMPDTTRDLGKLFVQLFGGQSPDIVFDGFYDPALLTGGQVPEDKRICIQNNGDATFANIDAPNNYQGLTTDKSAYDCALEPLDKTVL